MEHVNNNINSCLQVLLLLLLLLPLIQLSNGQMYIHDTYLSEVKFSYSTTNITSTKYEYTYWEYGGHVLGNYFTPALVMLPPESWSDLCGTAVPNTTKQEIQFLLSNNTNLNFHNIEAKDVWLFLNGELSSKHLNNSCSTTEKMKNVERLNNYLYRYNKLYRTVTTLILMGDIDVIPISYVNDIDLYAVDKNLPIENSILHEQNISGTNAHFLGAGSFNWSYYMAVTRDMNEDSKITLDDYHSYLLYEESRYSNNYTSGSTDCVGDCGGGDNSLSVTFKIIGSVFVLICFTLFCLKAKNHSNRRQMMQTRQELNTVRQGHVQGQRQQQLQNQNTNTNNNTNSVSLTENDFASLPQMIYHTKTELAMTSIDEDATIVDCDAIMDEAIEVNEPPDSSSSSNNKNIALALEEINNSTGTASIANQQQSLSFFRKTYGVSLKAIECCSICLEEFNEDEVVTALPRCCHLFHTACIGQWLLERKSNKCPMCKSSVLKLQDKE